MGRIGRTPGAARGRKKRGAEGRVPEVGRTREAGLPGGGAGGDPGGRGAQRTGIPGTVGRRVRGPRVRGERGSRDGAGPGCRLPGIGARGAGLPGAAGRRVTEVGRHRGRGSGDERAPVSGVGRGGAGGGPPAAGRGEGGGGAPGGGGGRGAGWGAAGRPGMASMAAAIAASRSAVMSGNRPLDDRERKRFTYFSSLSPMARKIMQDKEKIREKYGPEWARLPPAQQDEIIDRCLVGPSAPAPRDPGDSGDSEELARFPGLRGPTGQKVVRFGDEVGEGRAGDPEPLPAPRCVPNRVGTCGHVTPKGRGGRGWKGEGAGMGVGGRGVPEPKVGGWGLPRGSLLRIAERRRSLKDPQSKSAPLGRTGSRDFSQS